MNGIRVCAISDVECSRDCGNSSCKREAAQPDERAAFDLPPLPEPFEVDWPELHSQALGCGVEDRNLHGRYECAEYGWQDGVDKAAERVPEEIFTADQMREYAFSAVARATAPQAAVKGDPIFWAKRIMVLVDKYEQTPTMATRSDLRSEIMDALLTRAAVPQIGATLTDEQRDKFEKWVAEYRKGKPYWSAAREEILWDAWQASRAASRGGNP